MAAKFLRFLKELLNCRNGRLLVIGTMRYDHLEIYESPDSLGAPYFYPWRLGPFPRERIEEIISKPAKRANIEFTDELVERLKRDTPTVEALPLLAFTLEKLYRRYADRGRIDVKDYESLGGMEGSIQTCINGIISSKPLSTRPAQLAVARSWPKKRRGELLEEEVNWIKAGINSERIRHGIAEGRYQHGTRQDTNRGNLFRNVT